MSLYSCFYPDIYIHSVMDIDIEMLKKKGIKYVILDIDNTLVPYTMERPDENALSFLNKLKDADISYCFVSNNDKSRVELFNETIKAPFFAKAKKPLLKGINEGLKYFNADKSNTAMIGDQIFTDIFGAKRAGLFNILVEPIEERENLFFRFKRYFEKKVIKSYRKYIENVKG